MTLSPADRTRLRTTRGEFMEGVEVVSITRADLDALLPREITTVEELDALPVGSVVLDDDGDSFQRQNEYDDESATDSLWAGGSDVLFPAHWIVLPTIVLHEGDPR